jgi:predicted small secreted protein
MKKYVILSLVMVFMLLLSSCQTADSASVDISELQQAMLDADDSLPEMKTIDSSNDNADSLFTYLSDVDYTKVSGYFLSYCADGKQADEIAVVELKNASDKQDMLQSLKDHVDGRINLYSTYGPDQVSKAENALIFDKDNYVVLIISDNQNDVRAAFERLIDNAD